MTMKWYGDEIKKIVNDAVQLGGILTAELILTEAKKRCPRLTGTLSRSGNVTINELPNPEVTYNIAKKRQVYSKTLKSVRRNSLNLPITKIYISFNTPYAHRQHEDLTFSHSGEHKYPKYLSKSRGSYTRTGQAKFLETAFNEKKGNYDKIISIEITKALKNGKHIK